ncbi:repressor protein C2 domain protein [Achromobacter xylosoxidans A8]|uniref:Repressor protein C2 domain protein n=1 Tax=Achromobacter xylosoxidans (strain A8) TaxID=762376 RepID=E3HTS4_ACHXA|nr:S24 family peptidase [Achromobacter xylosoxidans]ADP17364.1 repressor protein C2 domain protein [Achromobacter xylosoxidans A8]
MHTFGDRLKFAIKLRGTTAAALARHLGVAPQAIYQVQSGKSGAMNASNAASAAEFLRVPIRWLTDGEGSTPSLLPKDTPAPVQPGPSDFDANVVPAPIGSRRVPLINYVQAGELTEIGVSFSGEAMEYLLTDLRLSDYSFALEIQGDSMSPEFRPGDRIIVDREVCPRPGDFVVARNGGYEATFKKYRPRGISETGHEVFELVPLNEDYPTLYSERQPLIVIGTMVEHRKYYRR